MSVSLLWYFLGSVFTSQAQTIVTTYTTSNSPLPFNTIRCISINKQVADEIWIGTDYGMAILKEETAEWEVFFETDSTLLENQIRAIAFDENELVWIGGFTSGLTQYNPTNNTWQYYTTANADLPDNSIKSIYIDANNTKWIATAGGLAQWNTDDTWQIYSGQQSEDVWLDNINDVSIDQNNAAWFCPINNGLMSLQNTLLTPYQIANSDVPDNTIIAITVDHNNLKWMTTAADGLSSFDDNNNEWQHFNINNSNIPSNATTAIVTTQNGYVIAGTTNIGISIYHEAIGWQNVNTNNSILPNNHITSLALANDSLCWAGTFNGGIALLQLNNSTSVASTPSAPNLPIHIYPNPVSHLLHIQHPFYSNFEMRLYDVNGRVLPITTRNNTLLNVSNLANGVYYLHFLGAGKRTVRKVVVLH